MPGLALSYRPLSLSDVVGQQHIKPILKAMIKQQRVPSSMLFSGTRGTGKTSVARIFSAALNCEASEEDACGKCSSCVSVQKAVSSSVIEIDAASNGSVEQVRGLKEKVILAHENQWRVVLIDEAHSMSKEANNALLKSMEEPAPYTVYILVTTEPEKILETVRSRAMPFEFRRIRQIDLQSRLRHICTQESIEAEDSLLYEIAKNAQGGLRDAVMMLDQISLIDGIYTAQDFRDFWGVQDYSLPIMWSALRGDYSEGYRLIGEHFSRTGEAAGMVADLSKLVSELLVIKSDGRPFDQTEESLQERVEMAKAAPVESLVRVIEVLWDLKSRIKLTENDQRSSMDMAFALIADALKFLHVAEPVREAEPVQEERVLSMQEIASLSR